ncbi:hypothetical protein [Leptospira santarosai]|uniref:Uncharacterized protein n=1 Tax=Leptospira santarosai str. ZUN179 TaxID=1049985 RepID=M6VAK1_9LEPT|nr:hypothetical protein [Leptospira santarosai]EMO46523.1 hypothetical protein LEP1GSC187_2179 [Leptospira santarosai str. ZUN179]
MNKLEARKQYESLMFLSQSIYKIKNQTARVMLHLSFELMLNQIERLISKMEVLQTKIHDPEFQKEIRREKFLHKQIASMEATADILCIPAMRRSLLKHFEHASK